MRIDPHAVDIPDDQKKLSMSRTITLNLALQGGGAHGAFTWGVLDRLLDDPGIEIGCISGTSAGAMNGAALATGLARGGREAARENLARLWTKVAEIGAVSTLFMLPLRKPSLGIWDDPFPLVSPYLNNALGTAPLRYVAESVADIDLLRRPGAVALHVNAVNVRTGAMRLFGPQDLSIDALLASACAPQMFEAVPIDGQAYWDGSYGANPVMAPLYRDRTDCDLLLVELTPMHRAEVPVSAKNILNRINEIVSVAGLSNEMLRLESWRRTHPGVRTHLVSMQGKARDGLMEPSVKRNADWVLFDTLRREGFRNCDEWLGAHRHRLGRESTADFEARYVRPHQDYSG
jgi:NTE family protein